MAPFMICLSLGILSTNYQVYSDSYQEIDFLTLLQSFGVDMGSVAHALGVDINTLINMDKDVLMHLLTSHSSSGNN